MEKSQHTDFNEGTTNESAIWHVSNARGYESWILRKNEATRRDAFVIKGQRKILQVS